MIKVEWFYWVCAAFFAIVALIRLTDSGDKKRFGSAAFWGILAFAFVYVTFVVAKTALPAVDGFAVLGLAGLAGLGFPGKGAEESSSVEERRVLAGRFSNKLFIPALIIPLVAVFFCDVG